MPECSHQDSVGPLARTVRDAVLALDAIFGIDPRDNYTLAQRGKTPSHGAGGGYARFLATRAALKHAVFGLPWASFWVHAEPAMRAKLLHLVAAIEAAGATVVNGTELPNHATIVSPQGWDWDWGATRGYPNESEYTVVKVPLPPSLPPPPLRRATNGA